MEARKQFTALLDNSTLSRVERMRLLPMRRRTNRSRGEHLAGKGGTSTEFNDYRDYSAGDDMRYVDWNIFSRLNRPYVKLYRHEEEMHVVVLVDASASMRFGEKFEKAKQLAACFAIMGLMNLEKVSVFACQHAGQTPQILPPCSGRMSMKRIFSFLEDLPPGGDFPIDEAVEAVLKQHRGRGVCVILSDFLTFGAMERPMNQLFSAGLEVFGIQLLCSLELNPELTGDLRFVDSENGMTLDVSSVGDLIGFYHEHLAGLQEHLATLCRQRSGRFLCLDSGLPLETMLFDTLKRKGWVQ
ncbi:DUF58 domain-containing protein [Schlesneria sp. T3-172]|uniref:DUF58 domain-containing protein n=2 Tax=Schlesneria TaxID=656899 RepID=UPI0037CAD184